TGIRAPGRDRPRAARAGQNADAVRSVELLDRSRTRLHLLAAGQLAETDGQENGAARERRGSGRHRKPGDTRRVGDAAAAAGLDRSLRPPRAAGDLRTDRDVSAIGRGEQIARLAALRVD